MVSGSQQPHVTEPPVRFARYRHAWIPSDMDLLLWRRGNILLIGSGMMRLRGVSFSLFFWEVNV